jgi:hypothetical protein
MSFSCKKTLYACVAAQTILLLLPILHLITKNRVDPTKEVNLPTSNHSKVYIDCI